MEQQWIAALAGGTMAGLACLGFLLVNGRVAGVSGILGGLVDGTGAANRGERAAFIAGLAAMPGLYAVFAGAQTNATDNAWLLVAGGLMVGFGARVSNGCTSGHGVAGVSRLSPRSLVATACHVFAGALAVAFVRQLGA